MKYAKNIIITFFYLLFISFFFQSCSDNNIQKRPQVYFDLKYFVDSITQDIAQKNFTITKIVTVQDDKQELRFSSKQIDWQKELKLFGDANINKTSLVGKYKIVITNDSTIYLAKDSSLSLKKISIITEKKQLKTITIEQKDYNFFYKTNRLLQLNFENNQINGYQIKGSQKLIGLATNHFEVKSFFNY